MENVPNAVKVIFGRAINVLNKIIALFMDGSMLAKKFIINKLKAVKRSVHVVTKDITLIVTTNV